MNINQILSIEPSLQDVIDFVKQQNEMALTDNIWWHEVWDTAKSMMKGLIGYDARNYELSSCDVWDTFHDYLYSISKNLL